MSSRLRRVFCSIIRVDIFTLTFRQLERLVRRGLEGGRGLGFLAAGSLTPPPWSRWLKRRGC